jgi:hypothetical protein
MEEKLQKEKEEKEAEKIKAAEKEEQNVIKEVEHEPEIAVVTEKVFKVEEKPTEKSEEYDVNSPRFPSSETKHNIQPSFSTDTHEPHQTLPVDYHREADSYEVNAEKQQNYEAIYPKYAENYEHHQKNHKEKVIAYTPGPIRVPTAESEEENFINVSDLPPVPDTIVEQERLEMIEIQNVGTSGHLSHSLS